MKEQTVKHTPGPCSVEYQTLERALMVLDPKRLLYEITQGGECVARAHTKEWANLIAAARELLAIAEYALMVSVELGGYLFDKKDDVKNPTLFNRVTRLSIESCAAITKAEGAQP